MDLDYNQQSPLVVDGFRFQSFSHGDFENMPNFAHHSAQAIPEFDSGRSRDPYPDTSKPRDIDDIPLLLEERRGARPSLVVDESTTTLSEPTFRGA